MIVLSDSVKKGLIIGSTAVLPKAARVAMRRSMLADLEVGIAERARLLIIAHPKSGNTWLKTMISRLYQQRFDLPEHLMNKSDEYTRRHPQIPRLAATNGVYSYEGAVGEALKKPGSKLAEKAIVFLPRHPCDIAVSWFLQFTKRQSRHKQELINASIEHPIDKDSISLWDFVRHSDIGLPSLIAYLNGWAEKTAQLPRAITVRYEDLRAEPAREIRRIGALMGETFTEEELEEAVRFGSFENLRQLESQGFFRQGGLNLRNPQDPESFKVRRAKVGGYRDYFTAEQIAELESLMVEGLSPDFGYRPAEASAT